MGEIIYREHIKPREFTALEIGDLSDSLARLRVRISAELSRDAGRAEMLAGYVLGSVAKALGGSKEDPSALGARDEESGHTSNTAALRMEARRGETSARRIIETVESPG